MTDRLVEKATDVNLACDMVWDSFDNSLECLALVTNDSDFRMVLEKSRLNKKKTIVLFPVIEREERLLDLVNRSDDNFIMKLEDVNECLLD